MRRTHYLVIILLLIAQTSFGQIYQNMAQPGYKFSRARFDSVLTIPTGLGGLRNITGGQDTGQIRFNVSDSSVYVWNGRGWIKPVGGGGSGSIDYVTQGYGIRVDSSGRVYTVRVDSTIVGSKTYIDAKDALKLNIADTAAMLTPYAKTAALALKLNISDTANMLSAYPRSAAVTSALALKLNITDTIGNGDLFIRNLTTQENKRFNVKGGRLDTLYASTSGGGRVVSNSGTIAAEWGLGGGSNFDFYGFAGYNANRASSYTTRSFTDKNYVDSSLTLKTTVSSFGKNATRDSTILLLSNGTRFAARDSIGGGGGGSTKAYAPLIVRNDSVFQRFNVLAYGADNTGTTDATVAIQAAINACDAAGGGEVYFPNGTYLIAGAINATYNSQLYIPTSTIANRRAFLLIGESTNLVPFGGGLSLGASALPPTNGVILKSSLSTFTNAGQAVIGTVVTGNNASSLTIKNIGITVKNNPSGTGPVVGGINWSKGTNCRIEDSYVVIDTSGFRSVNPQNDVTGIELPDNSSNEFYTLSNCIVGGFFNGYKLGEHAMLNNVAAMVCKNGYFLKQGSHTTSAPRAGAYWCVNAIYVQDYVTLAPFKLDVEWQNIGKWYDNVYTIKDTTNRAKGQLNYTIIVANIGKDNTKFAKLGADNLFTMSDDDGLAILSSNTFTSTAALTQTFNQTGSATANFLWQKNGVSRWSLGNDASGTFNDFYLNDLVNSRFKIYANGGNGDMSIGANSGAASTAGIFIKNNNDVSFNNGNFYYSAANESVGIGTGVSAQAGFSLEIKKPNPYFVINSNTSRQSSIFYQQNGTTRWQIGMDFLNNGIADFYVYDQTNTKVRQYISTSGTLFLGGTANALATSSLNMPDGGGVGVGNITPTARLHIAAGTATASTAPLKLTAGTKLTTPEAGAIEYVTGKLVLQSDGMTLGSTAGNSSAKFEVQSTTQGFLMPRMDSTQRNLINTPATGLQIYNTNTNAFNYYNGTAWTAIGGGGGGMAIGGSITGATAGSVLFAGTSGVLAQDNAKLFWNNTNKRLGIGTTSPTAPLDIAQTQNETGALDALFIQDLSNIQANLTIKGGTGSTDARIKLASLSPSLGGAIGSTAILTNTNDDYSTFFPLRLLAKNVDFEISASNYASRITAMRIESTGSVGIGTTSPNASSLLDITSTTKGVLFPRMTTEQKNNIASPVAGLVVYDTTLNKLCVRTASAWETITSL